MGVRIRNATSGEIRMSPVSYSSVPAAAALQLLQKSGIPEAQVTAGSL